MWRFCHRFCPAAYRLSRELTASSCYASPTTKVCTFSLQRDFLLNLRGMKRIDTIYVIINPFKSMATNALLLYA